MNVVVFRVCLGLVTVLGVTLISSGVAVADTIRFKQFVAPLDCVKEVVNNGVSEEVILSPQECNDVLHPKPPVDNESGTENSNSGSVASNSSPRAPNTGSLQRFMDAVHESGFIPIASMILLAVVMRKAYKTAKS